MINPPDDIMWLGILILALLSLAALVLSGVGLALEWWRDRHDTRMRGLDYDNLFVDEEFMPDEAVKP